jgi:hypothetical protein
MPGWLWAVIAIVLGVLLYLALRRRGGGRHRGVPAIEYFPDEDQSRAGPLDGEDRVELEGHVDREGHVELEGHVEREGRAGDVSEAPRQEIPEDLPVAPSEPSRTEDVSAEDPRTERPSAEQPPTEVTGAENPRAEHASAEEPRAEPAAPSRAARTDADPDAPAAPDMRGSGYGAAAAAPVPAGAGPQGWTVKGNADSMLFYTADAPGYLRSAADVWFESEEAAITAGFTRWNAHHR